MGMTFELDLHTNDLAAKMATEFTLSEALRFLEELSNHISDAEFDDKAAALFAKLAESWK